MQRLTPQDEALLETLDGDAMLAQTCEWSAVNTGTANLAGLAKQAGLLANAFSALPGDI